MHALDSFFRGSRFLTAALLFLIPFFLQAENYVLINENVIDERAVVKINEMGEELFSKDNISVYAFVKKSADNASLKEYVEDITNGLKTPYVLLLMLSEDRVVDIINSPEVSGKFDKEQILSPIPSHGTIRPLLVIKKDYDGFSAAMLNGYADIVEQIAQSDNVTLSSAVGDTNRETLQYIRVVVYALFVIVFFIYIYKRVRYRHGKKQ